MKKILTKKQAAKILKKDPVIKMLTRMERRSIMSRRLFYTVNGVLIVIAIYSLLFAYFIGG